MRNEFVGTVLDVREVEDCIRSTRKYTKGVFRKAVHHPVQGEDFPSKVVTEYYEVYPDLDLGQEKSLWGALLDFSDWLWGETPHIDLRFHYNYPKNLAMVVVFGGNGVVKLLEEGIPGFGEALGKVIENRV